jgi:hypothetical protein
MDTMSQPNNPQNTPDSTARTVWEQLPKWFQDLITFFWEIIRRIFTAIRSLFFLLVDTFTMVLPSVALTSRRDDDVYLRSMRTELKDVINKLDLNREQKDIILKNWLEQYIWSNNRANRERNANELIRWWQIILGVLIPVLTTPVAFGAYSEGGFSSVFGENQSLLGVQIGSILGVFVAVLTAIGQFRRPEERWRHYRILAENYLMELWDYITLSGEDYKTFTSHSDGFKIFNQRMTKLRRDDVNTFFAEVSARTLDLDQMQKQLAEFRDLVQNPGVRFNSNANASTEKIPENTSSTPPLS